MEFCSTQTEGDTGENLSLFQESLMGLGENSNNWGWKIFRRGINRIHTHNFVDRARKEMREKDGRKNRNNSECIST